MLLILITTTLIIISPKLKYRPDLNLTTLFERITHAQQRQNRRQVQANLVEKIWERFGHDNNES
jgi:hypothetical protein